MNDGSHQVLPSDIETARSRFNSRHLNSNQLSFYSNNADETGLGNQIDDDKKTIEEMNRCIEELAEGMPGRIKTATEDVLAANARPLRGEEIYWFINQNDKPHEGAENWNEGKGYLRYLRNSEGHERKFLAFADCFGNAAAVFQTGIEDWFERANRKMRTGNAVGLQRAYLEYGYRPFGNLVSTWTWWSTRSIGCELVDGVWVHGHADPLDNGCPHAGVDDRCHLTKRKPGLSPRHLHEPKLHGNSVCIWDDRYEGAQARPLILRDTYFGEKGTITVGLACYNENPWYGIFQNSAGVGRGILSGIFAAFNPYKDVEWSWAFSSAKAGYKFKNEDLDRRDYMIDWKGSNQSWNLCQSDWDAVFVPVRRAVSKAEDGEWTYREGPPLDAWIKNGDWQPLKNSGGAYVVSNMPRLPGMNGSGSGINWNRVAEMLYH